VRIDGPPRDAEPADCPYLPDRKFTQNYFFGTDADPGETAALQAGGWRRFGAFFFRPHCEGCRACRPVRLDAAGIVPTASQMTVMRKNADVEFRVAPLEFRDEYYEVYRDHSETRFGKHTDPDEFQESFFHPAVPAFVTEYRVGGTLAGLGFCDEGADGLSSVYFVFRSEFEKRSLGTFSVLRECAYAAARKKRWYYLGYWVEGNATMAYKGRFFPRQVMEWETGIWR